MTRTELAVIEHFSADASMRKQNALNEGRLSDAKMHHVQLELLMQILGTYLQIGAINSSFAPLYLIQGENPEKP